MRVTETYNQDEAEKRQLKGHKKQDNGVTWMKRFNALLSEYVSIDKRLYSALILAVFTHDMQPPENWISLSNFYFIGFILTSTNCQSISFNSSMRWRIFDTRYLPHLDRVKTSHRSKYTETISTDYRFTQLMRSLMNMYWWSANEICEKLWEFFFFFRD